VTAPAADPAGPRLAVVLVNRNRWQDTIESIEALLRGPPLRVVVIDIGSTDDSLCG